MEMQDLINGRCGWCGTDSLYVKYHDEEWGKLVTDDRRLFEFLTLESDFDINKVAQMTEQDVERLMQDEGIVRNRLKIKSAISNAKLFIAIQKEFGSFYNYTLSFFPEQKPISYQPKTLKDIQASTPESDAMSKDMKKRGFKFFGSTICYAYLQAAGFVNDHLINCICRK